MSRIILSLGKMAALNEYLNHLITMSSKGRGGPYNSGIGYGIYFENQLKVHKILKDPESLMDKNEIYGTAFIGYAGNEIDTNGDPSIVYIQPYTHEMLSFVSDSKVKVNENGGELIFNLLLKGFAHAIVNLRQMEFDSLNFILTDGKYAAAYREVRKDWALHSLFYKFEEDRFTVSSEEMHGKWYELDDRTLLIFRDGRIKEYNVKEEVPHVL
jgi:hypothetical protein